MRPAILAPARLDLRLSLSTISVGVLRGRPAPYQDPGMNSAAVGTSGSAGQRAADVTARGRSLPLRTNAIEAGSRSIITRTWPAYRPVPAPRPDQASRFPSLLSLRLPMKIPFPQSRRFVIIRTTSECPNPVCGTCKFASSEKAVPMARAALSSGPNRCITWRGLLHTSARPVLMTSS
jgi:hypothetical protein